MCARNEIAQLGVSSPFPQAEQSFPGSMATGGGGRVVQQLIIWGGDWTEEKYLFRTVITRMMMMSFQFHYLNYVILAQQRNSLCVYY